MTHLLLVSLIFPPDNVSTAHLMGEMASDLVERGHRVTVLTTVPHFNRDAVAERNQPLQRFWGGLLRKSEFKGATVYHSPVLDRAGGLFNRVIGWAMFHVVSLIAGLFLARRVDVILSPSPPLSVGIVSWILGLWHRAPFIYNAQELYPDIAVSLGVIRNRLMIWFMYRIEKFVYSVSAYVTVISGGMRDRILEKGIPADKVVHVPNWVDTADIDLLPKDNEFSREHDVQDEFVVGYAGNMGLAQSFDEFIEAAELLKNTPGIRFMLIGDGVERPRIKTEVEQRQLLNVTVLPYQPYSLVPLIYASTDLSYVPLHGAAATHALPSKVYRIMASGRTILAVAGRDSGVAELINDSGSGILVEPGSGEQLAKAIVEAASDPARVSDMGRSGREFVVANYSRSKIVDRQINLITKAAHRK